MAQKKGTKKSKNSAKACRLESGKDIIAQLDIINDTVDRLHTHSEHMIRVATKKLELQSTELRKQVQQIHEDVAKVEASLRAWLQEGSATGNKHISSEKDILTAQSVAKQNLASLADAANKLES